MLEMIKDLAKLANDRKFAQSHAKLKQLEFYFKVIQANLGSPLGDYARGALNELMFQLQDPTMTDVAFSQRLTQMSKALQMTQQLVTRMMQHSKDTIVENKRALFDQFINEDKALRDAIHNQQKRLSLQEILELNQRLERILRKVHGEKQTPATPAPVSNSTPSDNTASAPKKLGFKFLDALTSLFKGLASPDGNTQSAMSSFAGVIVELVVNVIGDFFKAFLGKEAAPKVDKMVHHASEAMQKMFVPSSEVPPSVKKAEGSVPFTPGFAAQKQRKDKDDEKEKGVESPRLHRRTHSHTL